ATMLAWSLANTERKFPLAAGVILVVSALLNGGCSSMVELRFVVPAVAGSSPVSHPRFSFAWCEVIGGVRIRGLSRPGRLGDFSRAAHECRARPGLCVEHHEQTAG